jgi:hypothetical protein
MIFSRDTSPEAELLLIQLLRTKTFAERLEMVGQLNELARTVCLSGLRARHPDDDDETLEARHARLTLGSDLATRVLAARAARRDRLHADLDAEHTD